MKARVIKKRKSITALILLMFLSVFVLSDAHAGKCCMKANVPVAICSTGGTNIPLPRYVCCQLRDNNGHVEWRNTWVPTTCMNADCRATYDLGCKHNSPVYGMGSSIIGNCQFSHSTGKCL